MLWCCRHSGIRRLALWVAVAGTLGLEQRVNAQTFGRWWWDLTAAAGRRTNDNLVGSTTVGSFRQNDLRVAVGINGFIIHPGIAQFRLGASLANTSVDGGGGFDLRRSGYEGNLAVLPAGRYPLTLFAQRATYGYSSLASAHPFTLLSTPDTVETWGGRLRSRGGLLRGALIGFDSTRTDYVEPGAKASTQQRQFFDWTGTRGSASRRVRLENEEQQFGFPDFRFDTLTAIFEQQRPENGHWNWNLSGAAQRRDIAYSARPGFAIDSFRLRNSIARTFAQGRQRAQLLYEGSLYTAGESNDYESHMLTAQDYWRRNANFTLSPFVRFGWRHTSDGSLTAGQAGLEASYARVGARSNLLATSSLSILEQTGEGAGSGALAGSLAAAVGFGAESGWRRELEAAYAHNELRSASEALSDLPDLGLSLAALGTEDFRRARASLSHRRQSRHAVLFAEYSDRQASVRNSPRDFSVETLSGTLQVGLARVSLTTSIGETEATDLRFGRQRIDFSSSSASLRIWRNFSLRATYRADDRQLVLAPSLRSERWEAEADLRVGEFVLRALSFESREEVPSFAERRNRGLIASISRSTAGWLPWVTAPKRRGIVR